MTMDVLRQVGLVTFGGAAGRGWIREALDRECWRNLMESCVQQWADNGYT